MAQYGEYLNTYDPRKEEVYRLIDNFFDHPVMTKSGNEGNFSLYMVKLHSLLALEQRFLIAVLPIDNFPVGYKVALSELFWESFNITKMNNQMKGFMSHHYHVKRGTEYQRKISLYDRKPDASYYDVEYLPIVIAIQHGKKSGYSYQKEGTLLLALETFSTIISFKPGFSINN